MARFGRDKGCDIPARTDYVNALRPLRDAVGEQSDPDGDPVHAGRDQLFARTRAFGGVYPALKHRATLVVP